MTVFGSSLPRGPTRCTVPSAANECPGIRTAGSELLWFHDKIAVLKRDGILVSEQTVSGLEWAGYYHYSHGSSY